MIKIQRFISYYKLKLARLPASPNAIASGFACGSMVSFTPLLGLHFILAIVIAYLIRGNLIAALFDEPNNRFVKEARIQVPRLCPFRLPRFKFVWLRMLGGPLCQL